MVCLALVYFTSGFLCEREPNKGLVSLDVKTLLVCVLGYFALSMYANMLSKFPSKIFFV